MKNCRCGWLAVFLVMIVSACAVVPVPDRSSSTMVIGMVKAEEVSANSQDGGGLFDFTSGTVRLTIENIRTHEKHTLKSNKNGFFFTDTIPTGRYTLKITCPKQPESDQRLAMNQNSNPTIRYFCIVAGKVNNLGTIAWQSDGEKWNGYRLNAGYLEVVSEFRNLDSRGKWRNVPVNEVRHMNGSYPKKRSK